MSAYDSHMTVGKMPNGQPCIRLPRGLVATMEAGSDATRKADAAEVARRWNTHADLLAALREIVGQDRPNRWGYDAAEVAMDDGWRERARAAMRAATGGSGAASDVACASARATGGGK